MPDFTDHESDSAVLEETKTKLKKPPLYKVVLHNDDFTTMEFVVFVLKTVFLRTEAEAVAIMLKVHEEGIGIAGIYTYEIANAKSEKAMALARSQEFPLLCTVEEES
jgi:ATP-dependent Clp protease adaptor protein ClpS